MDVEKKIPRPLTEFYNHFYEQYADSASFLWMLRSQAINRSDYKLDELAELDQRLENELDGLMTSPEESWVICESLLSIQQAPETFVASVLAFRSMDVNKIRVVVEAGMLDEQCLKGLVSALAWLPGRLVHSWIKKFLNSKDLNHKALALAACRVRREDPREFLTHILNREDCREHEVLHAQALRLVGELKRFDLITALQRAVKSDSQVLRFWGLRSLILLGDVSQAVQLEEYILVDNPFKSRAIFLAFRVLPCEVAKKWISILSQDPLNRRLIIQSVSVLGDPEVINWLIGQMKIPELMRLAGQAFSIITGIDLKAQNLILENLPNLQDELPEDENELVEINEDDYLPFPDVNKIAAVWQKYQHRFKSGSRYFMGQLLVKDQTVWTHLRNLVEHGSQPLRAAAAMELSLMDSSQFLFNHASKGIHHD